MSITWLPMNQTKLEKYGAAVQSRMNFNIDFSSTLREDTNISYEIRYYY